MMYPVAVEGRMPFVDHNKYREQQIKKVIQKHRAKRQRDSTRNSKNVLHQTLHRVNSPIGLALDRNMTTDDKDEGNMSPVTRSNILNAIKNFFSASSSKKCSKTTEKETKQSYQPRFQQNGRNRASSAPLDIVQSRKMPLSSSNSPPSVSPKRQRRRTVSHIGSIMETILEEIPENFVLEDDTDSSVSGSSDSLGSADSLSHCSMSSKSLDSLLNDSTESNENLTHSL